MAMTIGLSMFAAQYWGKGDKGAVERIFAYVMKVTAAVSLLFFLVGMCVPASGIVLLGLLTAFVLKLPVLAVYFIVNLDGIVKLPAVYRHYKSINGSKTLLWVKEWRERNEDLKRLQIGIVVIKIYNGKMEDNENDRTGKNEERLFMG